MKDEQKTERRTLVERATETALLPLHAAISKPAQKAYLGTALFTITTFFLLLIASTAFWLFYYNYVPQPGVSRFIHLQFGIGAPQGSTTFTPLAANQPYDITLHLSLPRTPANLATGNFMLDLALLPSSPNTPIDTLTLPLGSANTTTSVLARSRRPAILTYASTVVDTASTLTGLPWYVLGWKRESESLSVPMFEGVEFAKGKVNLPAAARVVVEADEKMQFYELGIKVIARFGGLRWVLYQHRILSFLVFTVGFWGVSVSAMVVVWVGLQLYLYGAMNTGKKEEGMDLNGKIKAEPEESEGFDPTSLEDLSDTARSFPGLGRAGGVRYEGRGRDEGEAKKEEGEVRLQALAAKVGEADDEDDGGAGSGWRDSGLGTGIEEVGRGVQRRRKSGLAEREV